MSEILKLLQAWEDKFESCTYERGLGPRREILTSNSNSKSEFWLCSQNSEFKLRFLSSKVSEFSGFLGGF